MMVVTPEALAKRGEKRRGEKEPTAMSFIDLTKHAIEVQRMESTTKLLAEENQIMFVDLSIMDPDKRACFEKKRAIIRERDA
jgi:hypothetical protein